MNFLFKHARDAKYLPYTMPHQTFSRQQWMVLSIINLSFLLTGMGFSLQAPFFPLESENRGLKATEYSLVMGIYQLIVFLVSPIIGKNLNKLGMKRTFTASVGVVGVSTAIFGTLGFIEDGSLFLALSFLLRIIEGLGFAGIATAGFSCIVYFFPDNTATMFGISRTFSCIGAMMGPFLGGLLYEAAGYTLPFITLGAGLLAASILIKFLPLQPENKPNADNAGALLKALKIPDVCAALLGAFCVAMSNGLLLATLVPYMHMKFDMDIVQSAYVITLSPITYGVSTPIVGIFCKRCSINAAACFGATVMIISFALIGPLPFLQIQTSQALSISAYGLSGIAGAFQMVSSFTNAHTQAIVNGLPDTIETYGSISGLFTSFRALGLFVGASAAGFLFDTVGFSWSTLLIVCSEILILILLIITTDLERRRRSIITNYEQMK